MSGANVWSRNREKMRLFSQRFSQCAEEAAAYGRCVAAATSNREELQRDGCSSEFRALKVCFSNAAKKRAR